jgi:hypothetical protein
VAFVKNHHHRVSIVIFAWNILAKTASVHLRRLIPRMQSLALAARNVKRASAVDAWESKNVTVIIAQVITEIIAVRA